VGVLYQLYWRLLLSDFGVRLCTQADFQNAFSLRYHGHWNRRLMQHTVADAAQYISLERTQASCAHDDHRYLLFFSFLANFYARQSGPEFGHEFQALILNNVQHFVNCFLRFLFLIFAQFFLAYESFDIACV